MPWEKVCGVKEIPPGSSKIVDRTGNAVALFNVNGQIFAIDNACGHRGGPLGEGYLAGEMVTCPWHAWNFNVKTGQCESNPALRQKCFAVKVEKGEIFVEL